MEDQDYSKLRKKWQKDGEAPSWYTTPGVQLFAQKYAYQGETVKSRMSTIAKAMAKHAPEQYPVWWNDIPYWAGKNWEQAFFQMMWDGFASPSTPLMANGGIRKRGTTVSCAGGVVGDNLFDRYDAITEAAILTKHSHGTSYSIDAWPAEGTKLKRGGRSLGTKPLIRDFVQTMEEVTQGSRRGSLAYSLSIEHGDFDSVLDNLYKNTESNNVGWLIKDDFVAKLQNGDPEAHRRLDESLYVKLVRGKGYYTFIDKMNRHRAEAFKRAGLEIKASNLCVTPDTKILTRIGYQEIGKLTGSTLDIWNGEEWSEVTVTQTGNNQPIVRVVTDFGQELECTPYHKFYVQRDYHKPAVMVRASDLCVGDKLIKFDLPIIEGEIELDFAYTNGFYSGDGYHDTRSGRSMIPLYGVKQELLGQLGGVTNVYEDKPRDRTIVKVRGVKDKFFVPDQTYTVKSRLDWLAGLLDSDGTVVSNGTNQSMQIVGIEYDFLRDVQMMLQGLGVTSKVTKAMQSGERELPDGRGGKRVYTCQEAYRLLISSSALFKLSELGLTTHRLSWIVRLPQRNAEQFITIKEVLDEGKLSDTFCFTEKKRGMGMFNGILTGNCQEVVLPANEDYTFSCVILNENLERWYDRPENLMFVITVMSDCNISEYLETMAEMSPQDQHAMRKIRKFTEEFRALGSGVLGFHTLLQYARVPVASMEAIYLNEDIFSTLEKESLAATQWLAQVLGEPEGCKGLGIRNATRLMMPPTKSTAELMAGASEGIGLDTAFVFTKQSAGGELFRVNKVLLEIMKERGKHNKRTIRRIAEKRSVQQEDWLTDHEKAVFQTAFETDMFAYLRLCSQRQKHIDQGQSINTYFSDADTEEYISAVHKWAFEDENTLALYYIYSTRDSGEAVRITECEVCT